MSTRDRREYLTATVLDQAFLDRCQDNLDNGLEMVAEVDAPTGATLYASDRNKYVGGTFYEALTQFPVIKRSLGEWLSPEIEFSRLTLSYSNVDGRFNNYLPGGADFDGWVNRLVRVKVGLRDVASTYTTIYSGRITQVGGLQRDRSKITFITRDDFDRANVNFPGTALTQASFPDLEEGLIGTIAPVIYGDWTVELKELKLVPSDPASATDFVPTVPAYPVNGANAGVLAGTTSVQIYVAEHDLTYFDTAGVYLKRGEAYYAFNAADVTIISGNRIVDIKQGGNGGVTLVEGVTYQYASGDTFYVKVKGKDLGAYDDNIVWQARDILLTYGGITSGEVHSNWETYRDKASPAQSNIAAFKSRVWVQQPQGLMTYVLSLLEQVRLEAFITRDLKFKINSLHFEDFVAAPSFTIRNWDIEAGSFTPQLDDRNVWNRAQGAYNFDPSKNENARETVVYRNSAAITQTGKEISKKVVFPNLYEEATVSLQLQEMLKLASGYTEFLEMTLSPRAVLKDPGDFVLVNVNMGSTILENVPAMIRDIGQDPKGMRIPVKLWSFQMTPFPGYAPGYAGIVGGSTATITAET